MKYSVRDGDHIFSAVKTKV